jgi:hypothetical protein
VIRNGGIARAQGHGRVVSIHMAARAGSGHGRIVAAHVALGIHAGQRRRCVGIGQ